MKPVSILIPTYNRSASLAATLTSLCYQTYKNFEIIISDQNENYDISSDPTIKAVIRFLNFKGNKVSVYKNLPKKGMAHQRQFLLDKSKSRFSLFLDDDLLLEQHVLKNMVKVLKEEKCGFVGEAAVGLSYLNDLREDEEKVIFWQGAVEPEKIKVNGPEWSRYKLHNAANLIHLQEKLEISSKSPKKYKIAWVGGCVLYDTGKLRSCGGFGFWKNAPLNHSGEDVLAQLKVMGKYGGCALLPSGVYHQELPTTLLDRKSDLPKVLPNGKF